MSQEPCSSWGERATEEGGGGERCDRGPRRRRQPRLHEKHRPQPNSDTPTTTQQRQHESNNATITSNTTPNTQQAVIKPQYVDHIPKAVRGNVGTVLDEKDQRGVKARLLKDLDLEQVRLGGVKMGRLIG